MEVGGGRDVGGREDGVRGSGRPRGPARRCPPGSSCTGEGSTLPPKSVSIAIPLLTVAQGSATASPPPRHGCVTSPSTLLLAHRAPNTHPARLSISLRVRAPLRRRTVLRRERGTGGSRFGAQADVNKTAGRGNERVGGSVAVLATVIGGQQRPIRHQHHYNDRHHCQPRPTAQQKPNQPPHPPNHHHPQASAGPSPGQGDLSGQTAGAPWGLLWQSQGPEPDFYFRTTFSP
ncbi:hypothetical protein SKAU_G00302490 [Synaphobranchus kaupii]|uniref:Uncharacterized protein n=1 Tax=Synaphobranchus kaupii TaxID=118154 RepID=A0A9Q1EVX5_SYNKA|nr:hypothetical protein SKAU_G00302490 [Synaphobranchus kaupii]